MTGQGARSSITAQVRQDPQRFALAARHLIESARAASRSRSTYLGERYRRLARRRGDKKAIIAIANEILTATWQMLSRGEIYREQGPAIVFERDANNARRRAIHGLERLGHKVALQPLPQAA
jgi:transposase